MATSHQIASPVAAGKSIAADLAVQAGKLRTGAVEAAKGFDLSEAVAAGGYVAIGLYSVALIVNIVLGY